MNDDDKAVEVHHVDADNVSEEELEDLFNAAVDEMVEQNGVSKETATLYLTLRTMLIGMSADELTLLALYHMTGTEDTDALALDLITSEMERRMDAGL